MFFFSLKSKMAARGHKEIVAYKEFNIYSFVIPLLQSNFSRGIHFRSAFEVLKSHFCFVCKNPKWPPGTILKF